MQSLMIENNFVKLISAKIFVTDFIGTQSYESHSFVSYIN